MLDHLMPANRAGEKKHDSMTLVFPCRKTSQTTAMAKAKIKSLLATFLGCAKPHLSHRSIVVLFKHCNPTGFF